MEQWVRKVGQEKVRWGRKSEGDIEGEGGGWGEEVGVADKEEGGRWK